MTSLSVKGALVALATVFAASSLPVADAQARDRRDHHRGYDRGYDRSYRHHHHHDRGNFWTRQPDRYFQPSPWYTAPYVTVPVVPYVGGGYVAPRGYGYDDYAPSGEVVRCYQRDNYTGQRFSIPCPPSVLRR